MRRGFLAVAIAAIVGVIGLPAARGDAARNVMPAQAAVEDRSITHDGNPVYLSGGADVVAFERARSDAHYDDFRIAVGKHDAPRRQLRVRIPGVDNPVDCSLATFAIQSSMRRQWHSLMTGEVTLGRASLTCLQTRRDGYVISWGPSVHGASVECVRITRHSASMDFSFDSAGCHAYVRPFAGGNWSEPFHADIPFSIRATAG